MPIPVTSLSFPPSPLEGKDTTLVIQNGLAYQTQLSSLNPDNAKLDSVYSTVEANSAVQWNYQGTDIKNLSSEWVGGNSAFNTVNSLSSNWYGTYTTVIANSADWSSAFLTVNTLSGNWSGVFSTVFSTSATWVDTYTTVSSTSSNWSEVYATVNSLSSGWGAPIPADLSVTTLTVSNSATIGSLNIQNNGTIVGNLTATGNIDISGTLSSRTKTIVTSNTTYAVASADISSIICLTRNTDTPAVIVDGGITYPDGFQVTVVQLGDARVTLSGFNVTINQADGFLKTTKKYSAATLVYANNTWVAFGDLAS